VRRKALVLGAAILLAGCGREQGEPAPSAERGRVVYATYCTACHSIDPRRDGTLGPAVAGSGSELLEARVVRGGYPPGYAPKRETQLMVPLPQLAQHIDDLAAYLASAE
jgi:mono/diheme cytochrome c family protein